MVAVRVTERIVFGMDDYHFAVRLEDGSWADKRGQSVAEAGRITTAGEGWGKYNSKTTFIIVHFEEGAR